MRSRTLTLEVTPARASPNDEARAWIADEGGSTAAELLDWGLAQAEATLLGRQERKKILLVLHDGIPAWKDRGVTDFDLSPPHTPAELSCRNHNDWDLLHRWIGRG